MNGKEAREVLGVSKERFHGYVRKGKIGYTAMPHGRLYNSGDVYKLKSENLERKYRRATHKKRL